VLKEEVLRLTKGRGVNVNYDSIGADTITGSLRALAQCGHLISFRLSSGTLDMFSMMTLAGK